MSIENQQLEDLLMKTPILISEISTKIVDFETLIESYEKALKRIELKHLKGISAETGDDGKKKYSNEQVRAAVLQERIEADKEYGTILGSMLKVKEEVAEAKIDMQEQMNLFSAYKVVGNMKSG
jgi:hypothetical protein